MVFDRSEHEPEEPDPEADLEDPDSDSLTIPRVDTEDAGSGLRSDFKSELEADRVETIDPPEPAIGEGDVPSDLARTFWAVVLVVNGAVLAIAIGALLLLFEGDTGRSIPLLAGGLVLVGFAYRRYRNFQSTTNEDDACTSGSNDSELDRERSDDGKNGDAAPDGAADDTVDGTGDGAPDGSDDDSG